MKPLARAGVVLAAVFTLVTGGGPALADAVEPDPGTGEVITDGNIWG
ncbi:hypothetical protein [Nonomuraea dietziae]|uniref:Secreted protein n=1 Tax=Nonomuraea dietziae TaxID=65515 RepID=A0A7W5YKR0_9ACTN|nr:hypothetical protein [Nonomuraea dietziae]MBB3724372.1 hypothetical protein [Nonomuraea dietziae]